MIDTSLFIHPEDEKALKGLKAVPGLTMISKKILEYGYERIFYGQNLASNIRLSPTQLPHIYRHLPPICERLGMEEPEFYLVMDPIPNAYTFGDSYKFICVTSGLIELMSDQELNAVLAHECGHILCRHSLYHTVATTLLQKGAQNGLVGEISDTLLLALRYWQRKSELSCDRVSATITSPETVTRVMAKLAGGPEKLLCNLNLEEWIQQADQYDALYNDGLWNKSLQMYNTAFQDHPFSAVRVREVLKWGNSHEYASATAALESLSRHRCSNCGRKTDSSSRYCEFCGERIYE